MGVTLENLLAQFLVLQASFAIQNTILVWGLIIATKLKKGAHLFYPPHGVARVAGTEVRELGGEKHKFYMLELMRGGNVLLPTKGVDNVPLRDLISANKAKQLMRSMKTRPEIVEGELWKARAAQYNEDLNSGDAGRYTNVLRELLYRGKDDKLSTSEQNLIETARTYFVTELSTVLAVTVEKIEGDLGKAIEKGS